MANRAYFEGIYQNENIKFNHGFLDTPFKQACKFVLINSGLDITNYNKCEKRYTDRDNYNIKIWNDEEQQKIIAFIKSVKKDIIIFRNDNIKIGLALTQNRFDDKDTGDLKNTEINILKNKAKYNNCIVSLDKLLDKTIDFLQKYEPYKSILTRCYIMAVPPGQNKDFDLSTELVNKISKKLNITNITKYLYLNKDKPMKDCSIEEKKDNIKLIRNTRYSKELEKFFKEEYKKNSLPILLIDDLYQSGTTINHIANNFKKISNKDMYVLCLVNQ